MILEKLKGDLIVGDEEFNAIYPETIRVMSSIQWSPVAVSKMAARFLAEIPGTKVLDIGSGVGKFCIVGAACTKGSFTGVEQRPQLVEISNKLAERYGLDNANFVCANVMDIAFAEYDAFYFFNSFYENIDRNAIIDPIAERGHNLYKLYTRYVCGQLAKMPVGTRLVTYWTNAEEVPKGYVIQSSGFDGELKMWEKRF
jgi:SAM-dependent methyltransferase